MAIWIRVRGTRKARGLDGEVFPMKHKKPHLVKEFYDLRVNTRANRTPSAMFTTLFHEFLHVIFYMIQVAGIHFTGQSEHKFIEKIDEKARQFSDVLRVRKKKRKKK